MATIYNVNLNKPVIVEDDVVRGGFCVECFSPPKSKKRGKLFFYNGHGPFCTKQCYANFLAVDINILPDSEYKGKMQ